MRYVVSFIMVFIFFAEAKEMNSLFGIKIGQSVSELDIIECGKYGSYEKCKVTIQPYEKYDMNINVVFDKNKQKVIAVIVQENFLYSENCFIALGYFIDIILKEFNITFSRKFDENEIKLTGKSGRNKVIAYCTVIKALDLKFYNLTIMLIGLDYL